MQSRITTLILLSTYWLAPSSCFSLEMKNSENNTDQYTIVGSKNFLTGFPAKNKDGSINVVVEIPTGHVEKWEVDKKDGALKWEFKNGIPRKVKYLGYPGNYGMIPRTLLSKESGGDGDPLDVIILGPAVPKGKVVRAKLIGVLNLLDGGEQDDKLIAVLENTSLYHVNSIQELDSQYVGITQIIKTWFVNYKGPRKLTSTGFSETEDAQKILNYAIKSFLNK